jgi:hypothetical protein
MLPLTMIAMQHSLPRTRCPPFSRRFLQQNLTLHRPEKIQLQAALPLCPRGSYASNLSPVRLYILSQSLMYPSIFIPRPSTTDRLFGCPPSDVGRALFAGTTLTFASGFLQRPWSLASRHPSHATAIDPVPTVAVVFRANTRYLALKSLRFIIHLVDRRRVELAHVYSDAPLQCPKEL